MALLGAPSVLVLVWMLWTKRKHSAKGRRPFTGLPLRVAGESTRQKADELFESATDDMLLVAIGPIVGVVYGSVMPRSFDPVGWVLAIAVAVGTAFLGLRISRKLKKSWNYRLGAIGEQVVGRELDRLMSQGYEVFHDVQFDGWNIDHVVVGPNGVFAVETKAWRKPPKDSDVEVKIIYTGEALILPGKKPNVRPIRQARENARSLSTWIAKAAAESVAVVPVVALPGWSLSIKQYGDVAVYSATNMGGLMVQHGKDHLDAGQIQRISFQVAKLCLASEA